MRGYTWADFLITGGIVIALGLLATIHLWGEPQQHVDTCSYFNDKSWFKKSSRMNPAILSSYVCAVVVIIFCTAFIKGESPFGLQFEFLGDTVFLIGIYYSILAAAGPLLRRMYRAETCAALWVLPNALYVCKMSSLFSEPLFSIRLPAVVLQLIGTVWMIGFVAVLACGIRNHIVFKRRLMKDAYLASGHVRYLFFHEGKVLLNSGSFLFGEAYAPPMISPAISSPLSMGFSSENKRVFLPEKDYTDEELILIFRHELVHLSRDDAWMKFFLLVCRAICWFLPTTYLACKKAAEDMELSCDEMVLGRANEEVRHRYAELLLTTAASAPGFTTCLSASAEGLKYRLEQILQPQEKKRGVLFVILILAILFFASGLVGFASIEAI